MKNIKQISLSSFLLFSSIFLPINSFELERFISPVDTIKNNLIASQGKVRTVITIGYGKSVNEAAQNAAETALKQVVGSFIDSETLIKKRKEISNGIVKLSKTIKKDIQDYSQGSIQYFKILKIEEKKGIVIVEAKVEVLEGEFSNYIKEFALAESNFPGEELSIIINTNLDNKKSKAELLSNKILKPLEEGSVYSFKLEKFIFATEWNTFCTYNENKGYFKKDFCSENSFLNKKSNFVIVPMLLKLDENFLDNTENILNNIKYKKFRVSLIDDSTYSNFSNLRDNDLMIAATKKNSRKATIYLIKDVKEIMQKQHLNKYPRQSVTNSYPLLMWGMGRSNLMRYKSGVQGYGGLVVRIFGSGNQELFKLFCNAYECPRNENIHILQTSVGVDPQYSLFGCYQKGYACIPTIINASRYLLVLNFPPEILKEIKNINVEYQPKTNYLPNNYLYLF